MYVLKNPITKIKKKDIITKKKIMMLEKIIL